MLVASANFWSFTHRHSSPSGVPLRGVRAAAGSHLIELDTSKRLRTLLVLPHVRSVASLAGATAAFAGTAEVVRLLRAVARCEALFGVLDHAAVLNERIAATVDVSPVQAGADYDGCHEARRDALCDAARCHASLGAHRSVLANTKAAFTSSDDANTNAAFTSSDGVSTRVGDEAFLMSEMALLAARASRALGDVACASRYLERADTALSGATVGHHVDAVDLQQRLGIERLRAQVAHEREVRVLPPPFCSSGGARMHAQ
jgi:hypothetical protein